MTVDAIIKRELRKAGFRQRIHYRTFGVGEYRPFDESDGPKMAKALDGLALPGKPWVRYCDKDNMVYVDGWVR